MKNLGHKLVGKYLFVQYLIALNSRYYESITNSFLQEIETIECTPSM